MPTALDLPQDLASAHALIREMHARMHEMQGQIAGLEHRLDLLARRVFGRRREQLDPAQLELAFALLRAEDEAAATPADAPPETDAADEVRRGPRVRRGGHGRKPLPSHLPREVRRIEPESTDCPCCGEPMALLREERSEQLDYVPAVLRVVETVRPSYACRRCKDGVATAPVPDSPIARGKATARMLAHVAVSKYADHLPLNRQVGILARSGIDLSKQTLCGWIRQTCEVLEPVARAHWDSVLGSHVLQADETPVKLLDPPRPQCRKAYLWAYVGDRGEVAFDFSAGRGSEAPLRALRGFRGRYLQADAYSGYGPVERANPKLERVGCNAHMRRGFYDARAHDPPRALLLMAMLRELYDVEAAARAVAGDRADLAGVRLLMRRTTSAPLVDRLYKRLVEWKEQVLPKSPIGEAVAYAVKHRVALTRFLDDGAIDMDNNAAERALRTVAVGRSNWTFAGSEEGGAWAACLYGLLGTCRMQGIDPWAWLSDVLGRIASHPPARMHELTPRGWREARDRGAAGAR